MHDSYLHIKDEDVVGWPLAYTILYKFGTWMLLFANFVPISLIVTLEMVKFLQAQFIQWDTDIYELERDMPTKVQSSNLNE